MFGSISNWINNNLPQAIPPVNMPTMPNMPNIPDIFHTKNASTTEQQSNGSSSTDANAANKQAADNLSTIEPATSQQNAETKTLNDNVVGNNSNSESGAPGEAAGEQHMFAGMNMNIDIDPQKALGNAANTAKEIGSNIGNMLFSFGKNASTNVFKTANHLKDVIEKKVFFLFR